MKTLDYIKLDAASAAKTVNGLQQLLADFQVFYTNLRGFHWNVKGKNFFQLHARFEEMYNDVSEKIDEIAERILMLDGVPAHNFSQYLAVSKVKESGMVSDGDAGLMNILETLSLLMEAERSVLATASEAGDESTVAMMSDYLKEQEKSVWMLTAYFGK
ncbi:MAG: DNA starvation/stationary phase protection protein [Paludibacter sp. 47-17]|nr:MAG: DNA starvation/stationary phase protection protein [Paludibacter sp. SCN 50-10]OJX90275.1 MAG: DNA starvation/stationary phase protection protein [Paludibacter sp. 47-17]